MKKLYKASVMLLFSSIGLLSSCIPTDPEVPRTLIGKWELQTIDVQLRTTSAADLSQTENYEDQELFFQFLAGERFATNTDLSLNKLLLDSGNTITGRFSFTETNNRNSIRITVRDRQYNGDVELNFEIIDLESDKPILLMDKQDYVNSLRSSAETVPNEFRDNLITFSNRINQARFSLNFNK